MLKLNRDTYLDKLYACWIGKNIGGTMGGPYEGCRNVLDISGELLSGNEPLPNDDLDLQLAWLNALEQMGPKDLDANCLASYWLDWIPPHWNEYGICKVNLNAGLLPPMSGEIDNDKWKTSNGAWIRSEIWASVAPGAPDVAIKYAMADACVDHGLSEGTLAEIFTASMQSLAYVESDIKTLILSALSKIPDDSMIAKTVKLVLDCFESGVPYIETRERVVALSADLGWFQAPANIGFVIIGLLYGGGDYRRSLVYAINCGDDTDCTGATVGATLGIICGTKAIPSDLSENIGDRIVTKSLNGTYSWFFPKTCRELTERVYALVPTVMKANKIPFEFTDGENDISDISDLSRLNSRDLLDRSPYSYDINCGYYFSVRVEFDRIPRLHRDETIKVKLSILSKREVEVDRKLMLKVLLPEGWSIDDYDKTITLPYSQPWNDIVGIATLELTLTAGERVEPINRAYVELTSPTMPCPSVVPITIIG